MLAVIDIDGVLADVRHRLHHVAARPKDWPAFFAAAPHDPLLEEGARVAHALAGVHDVAYLSGRPEACRDDTVAWLDRHGLPAGELTLRPRDDRRPSRFFKVDALRLLARSRSIAGLVDDDPQGGEAARAAGFDVLPASWMGEQEELIETQELDGET
jgi:hypothetical protein